MPLFLLSLAIQILLAVHVVRTGRDRYWIFIILLFPGIGALIYFVVEMLPDLWRGPAGAKAKKQVRHALDPGKELRAARYAVETAPTVVNRLALAQLLMAQGAYDEVIAVLQPALEGHFAGDPALLEGMAYACYYKDDCKSALGHIGKIYANEDKAPKDYIRLLRARVLDKTGDPEAARAELTDLVKTYAGEEARVTLAQLHEKMGNSDAAREVYQDIVNRARHAPAYYQKRESAWISIAREGLQ